MLKLFNQNWKFIAGGGTILAYQAWFDRLQSAKTAKETKEEIVNAISSTKEHISELVENLNNKNLTPTVKESILQKCTELKTALANLEMKHNEYISRFENGQASLNSENASSMYETYKSTFNQAFSTANKKANEIADLFNNTTKNFAEENPILNYISDFKEYLSNLSAYDLCLIINILSSIFILTCIISIFMAISGNYLIDKFKIDQRYPKLSKFIQLRVKLQRYYVYINSIFIIFVVLSLIFVNTVTLINS